MNTNKDNKKKSLNNTLINIVITILLAILIIIIFFSFLIWQKSRDWISIISMSICMLGTLFNIYLLLKEKSN
ncbi:hypothetical protein [Clostridium sp.]|uniref:hypothetical protein n=1 Tax=Clostridium sp. TaxID=1506 RepID=UPI002639ECF6